jgi:hypothetical protein
VPIKEARKDFRFIAATAEMGKRMVFQGGIAQDSVLFRTQMLSRISNDLEQEREANRRELESEQRIDYGVDIKTKRLMGNIIREIHELSEGSEINGAVGPDSNEEDVSVSDMVKPS